MQRDLILTGIHIGEHSFEVDKISEELIERCINPGYNFVTIRTPSKYIERKYFYEWAQLLRRHKVYFVFLYTIQHAPAGHKSQLDRETVEKIKEIAGKYFLGDMIGETGSSFCCKMPGYYTDTRPDSGDSKVALKTFSDLKEAEAEYIRNVSEYINYDKEIGIENVFSVEATGLNKYNAMAGVDIPTLEVMCGNPELLIPNLRGVARAWKSKMWGTYVAHEWYGGMRHNDGLKIKRLSLAYKYSYISGSNLFCLESGDERIESFGDCYDRNSDICRSYRAVLDYAKELIENDCRPKGGPKVKVAFVSGLYDAYGGWGGSSLWNQFNRPEWAHGEAEYSWRLLEETGSKREWYDIGNYGDKDYSAAPAYGMYDIIPIEADLETLSKYEYLIFLGWNTMTDENLEKLTAYVENGGNLLMTMAHLNKTPVRGGRAEYPDNGKLEKLFGVNYTGRILSSNAGVKLEFNSLNPKHLYQGTKNFVTDPLFSAGYIDYAQLRAAGGKVTGVISESFLRKDEEREPMVIENKLGKGVATLIASTNYPGNPALMPLYRSLMREMLSSSHRNADIIVLGNDKLRFAVYEGDKVYLLNTDYDFPISVKIIKGSLEQTVTLEALELKSIQL